MNNFLTFYGGHDSGVAAFDGEKVFYLKMERISGIKHDPLFDLQNGGRQLHEIPMSEQRQAMLNMLHMACDKWNFKPDVIAYTSGRRRGFKNCQNENTFWEPTNRIEGFDVPTFCVDHHYAHVLSSWPVGNKLDFGVAVDGMGDHGISHKIIQNPWDLNNQRIVYQTCNNSLSTFLSFIGKHYLNLTGRSIDFAGKVMGAQSYGTVNFDIVDKIDCDVDKIDLLDICKDKPTGSLGDKHFNDWLATMHEIGIRTIIKIFEKYCPPESTVTFSGGCAQNSVLNERLHQIYKEKLFIPPHCYDGGLPLGCLEFLRLLYKLPDFPTDNFPYWQQDYVEPASDETILKAAKMLAEGKIIGWFQGNGEVGPRALGNRSILMNPCIPNGKDILNNKVKKREYWRPYAASVLETECRNWFDCDNSPHMLRAIKAKPDKEKTIPAVIHVDGTSRIQTVNTNNVTFYKLINEFYKLTEIPMLLNTSLNMGGQPIFSSKQQCLDMIRNSEIDVIFFGNEPFSIKSSSYEILSDISQ